MPGIAPAKERAAQRTPTLALFAYAYFQATHLARGLAAMTGAPAVPLPALSCSRSGIRIGAALGCSDVSEPWVEADPTDPTLGLLSVGQAAGTLSPGLGAWGGTALVPSTTGSPEPGTSAGTCST